MRDLLDILGLIANAVLRCVLAVAVLGFLAIGLVPHTGLYRTMTVLSGSMEPAFSAGDMVVVRPVSPKSVQVGDVIAFNIPAGDQHPQAHRVVSIVQRGQKLGFATRGDANDERDPWITELGSERAWKVTSTVPHVGHALVQLRTPLVRKAAIYGTPAILALLALVNIWRRREPDPLPPLAPRASARA